MWRGGKAGLQLSVKQPSMDALQVMADAADLCCHTLLHHCHSPKLLRSLCDVVRNDKNSKIRLCCAKYLLQASPWYA